MTHEQMHVQKKEQLDDFILGMSAHSDALAQDLATAVTTMRATLAAVHSHTLDLLRFFESNSYTPPQAVSAALNKAAAHVGADLSGDISFAASADGAGLGTAFLPVMCNLVVP